MNASSPAQSPSRRPADRGSPDSGSTRIRDRRRIARITLAGLAGLLWLGSAFAAPGDLDAGFGIAGRVQLQLDASGNDNIYGVLDNMALAQQGDGKIIVAAAVQDYSGTGGSSVDLFVARLNADGSLDTGFNGKGWTGIDLRGTGGYDYATAVLVQPDGKIVAAGYSTDWSAGNTDLALVRLNANGTLDTDFGAGGIVIHDTGGSDERITGMLRSADGSLAVAGQTNANGGQDALFARFDATGQLVEAFGSGGLTLVDLSGAEYLNALAEQADGALVGVGRAYGSNVETFVAIRVTADGVPDTTFDGDGAAFVDLSQNFAEARAVAVQADDKLLLAGFAAPGGNRQAALARLNADGSLDLDFGTGGTAVPDLGAEWNWEEPFALALQPDGRFVIAGYFNPVDPQAANDLFLARFEADGTTDTTFGNQGVAIADYGKRNQLSSAQARALLRQADGRLLVAGVVSQGGIDMPVLARFESTGGGSGGVLSFTTLSSYVEENAGTITITVRRTGGASGSASAGVRLGDPGGNYFGGEGCDFEALSTTVSWTAGDYADKQVSVNILQDEYQELSDGFVVELYNPAGAVLASDRHTVSIQPDAADTTVPDPGEVSIEPTKTVSEGAGVVTLTVTRSGAAQDCAVVSYNATTGFSQFPATAGVDFTGTSGLVQFGDGDTAAKQISIPILDDTQGEADEDFAVQISTPFPNSGNNSSQVTILDNDGGYPGQIIWGAPPYMDYRDQESDGPQGGPIVVSRIGGSNGAVSVTYTVTSGTATAGTDFVADSGTVDWVSGDTADKLVYVTIIDDTLEEDSETYFVTLSNATGGADLGVDPDYPWTQTILDNDKKYPGSFFLSADYQALWENSGQFTVRVLRQDGRDGAVSVNYATANGTATAGSDYTNRSGTLNWADGEGCDYNRIPPCAGNPQKIFTIPINDDADPEEAETLSISLSDPTPGTTLIAPSSITLTILKSDPLGGVIAITPATLDQTVSETAGTATIQVSRTGGTQGVVTVDYRTQPVTAYADVDYETRTGTLSWANGEGGIKTIVVPIINDTLGPPGNPPDAPESDVDEYFHVYVENLVGDAVLDTLTPSDYKAYVGIRDDESSPGELYFTSPVDVPENAGNAVIYVYRTGGSKGAVSVQYATQDGSAVAPGDYTAQTIQTLSWGDGIADQRTITIPINDDAVVEATETFTVRFSGAAGGLSVPLDTATVQILDNDNPGTISMSSASVNINEGNTTQNLSVTRSGGTKGAVVVPWTTVNGTATAAEDYAAASGTLSWADGEGGAKTLPVTILDDTIDEDDEQFAVTLSAPTTGSATLGLASTTVTILDNDANPGTLRFTVATRSVSETAATVQVDIERVNGSLGEVSVQYATSPGSALAGSDYTPPAGTTVSWLDGQKGTRSFSIPIANDTIDEPDEEFTVTLSSPTGSATLGTPATQTVTILDDDPPNGGVAITVSSLTVTEGQQAVLEVSRTGGSYGAISIDYATQQGSASSPGDYTAAAGTLNWADGETASKTITVDTSDDAIDEPLEYFDVVLTNPTGGADVLSGGARVNIADNDTGPPGTLALGSTTVDAAESIGTLSLVVTRSGGVSGAATVNWTTQDQSALGGQDYTAGSGTLSWDDFDGTSKLIQVAITNDTLDEPDEVFNVVLSGATGASLDAGATTAAVTILDDDLPPVPGTLAVTGPPSVDESGVSVTYTFSRTGGADGEVGLTYTTVDDTATAGADYTPRSGTLTWATGVTTSQTVTVPILEDALDEPHETFAMTIAGVSGDATLGTSSRTTVIVDNDVSGPGTLGPVANVTVFETVGNAIVQVARTNGFDGAVSVDYSTSDGSALAGSDYTAPLPQTLSWADSEGGAKFISIPILNDTTQEDPVETFTVNFTNAIGGATIVPTSATVNINDDDIPGTLGFTQTNLVASETGNTLTLFVARSVGSRGEVTVNFAAVGGTATAGSDFSLLPGTLTWTDGDATPKTITVTLIDDVLVEADEQFTVELSNAGGGATIGAGVATVTLTSDEIPQPGTIRMVNASVTVGEAAGPAVVQVERINGSDGAVSIRYDTANGTATAADYTPVTGGTLTWAEGDTVAQTINVAITNDTAYEPDETFAVVLRDPGGGAILAEASTTVTIQSDDTAVPGTLALATATATVNETAGTVTLNVTRTGGSDLPASVRVDTTFGSATAADFTPLTNATLNWTDGDAASKPIVIAIANDALFEADETFQVTLSNASNAALGTPATATVTIVSEDPPLRGTLAVAAATYSVNETAGTVTVNVTRTGGSDGAVSVDYTTADGTATAGADYTGATGTLNWADGDAAPKPITVSITNDAAWELDETFTVTVSNTGGDATLGADKSTVTIVSDDAPIGGTVAMAAATATVAEADGTVTLTVTRTGGVDGTVTVNYATAIGTAGAADFTAASGTLTWNNGDAVPKTITVQVTNDTAYEGDETFTVTLSGLTGAGASLGTPAATTVTITSDDPAQPGTLAFASATATVNEFAGTLTINVTRTGGSDLPASVDYATAPGTATAADFTARSGTLSWANGDAAAKPIVITITNDALFEADETFTVTLSAASGAALGTPNVATVTIVSEDPPRRGTLALASTAATVDETAGTVTLTVNRTGGTDGVVGLTYGTTAGTASTADFTPVAAGSTLSWADGDAAPKPIVIAITNDALVENDEAFAVTLSNPTGGAALGAASATVTIRDDDILTVPGTLTLSPTAVTVAETTATVTFTVTRTSGLGGTVSVQYATENVTATAGADYTAAGGTLTWTPGEATPRTFTVSITNDTAFEPDETFRVNLSNPGGGAALGAASATVTIQSEDPPPDTTPDAFTFTDVTGVLPGAEVQSNEITVSGINTATPISITGGEYAVNGGAWTSAAGTVTNGAKVKVRVNASAQYETTVSATLSIGGVSDTFSVTTREETTDVVVKAKGGGGAVGWLELVLLAGLALGLRLRPAAALAGLLLGCVALVPVARAQEAGLYFGVSLGQSQVGVSAATARERIEAATGDTISAFSFEDSDLGYGLTAGYAFNRNLAVEVGWYDFGETSSKVEAAVLDPQAFVEAMADAVPASVHGPAVLARATWPFAERWAAHLRAGVLMWESATEAQLVSGGSGKFTASRDGNDPIWGVALSWQPSPRFAVSLEFTQAQLDDELRSIGLGFNWFTGLE